MQGCARGRFGGVFALGGGGAKLDRDDLVIVDETGREEAAGSGIGLEVAGDIETGGLGDGGEGLRLGLREGGGEGGEALAARGFAHGLKLFFGEPRGEDRGQGIGGERNHREEAARGLT